jgi:hypothetical protein
MFLVIIAFEENRQARCDMLNFQGISRKGKKISHTVRM